MDPLTSAAASGIRARLQSLDMLANNIANTSAPGFKSDREFYSIYMSSDAAASPAGASLQQQPVIERQWTDFSQGSLTPTGSPLDLALNGKGFFVAKSPSGQIFTRNGSFQLSPAGQLQTAEGYFVQAQDGQPITVDISKPVEVAPDGTIRQDGQDVAKLAVVGFRDPSTLAKRGSSYFQTDLSTMPPVPAAEAEVQQGKIEAANSQPAESAVRLVNVLRQFEALQKALTIGAEMNRRVVEDVAKVTS